MFTIQNTQTHPLERGWERRGRRRRRVRVDKGQRGGWRMASTSEILKIPHQCKIRLRKFLESQKLIKCSHKAWVVRTQSLAPSGTKLGSPLHKAGVGSRTKRVPSGLLHLGGCIVLHGLTRSRLLYCGCPGVYFWDLWDVGTLRPKDYCAPTWRHCCLPPSGPLPSQFNTAH